MDDAPRGSNPNKLRKPNQKGSRTNDTMSTTESRNRVKDDHRRNDKDAGSQHRSTTSSKDSTVSDKTFKPTRDRSLDNEGGRREAGTPRTGSGHDQRTIPTTGPITIDPKTNGDSEHVVMHAPEDPISSPMPGAFPSGDMGQESGQLTDGDQGYPQTDNREGFTAGERGQEIDEQQGRRAEEEAQRSRQEGRKREERIRVLEERLEKLQEQETQAKGTYESLLAENGQLRQSATTLNNTWQERIQFLESQRQVLNASRSFAAREGTLDAATLIQSFEDLNSSIGDFSFEVLRGLDESADTPLTDSTYKGLQDVLTGDLRYFVEKARRDGLKASDLVDPLVMGIIVDELIQHVFKPFAPGLDPEQSAVLQRMYANMQGTEPQERSARWRSITYRHARPEHGADVIQGWSKECIGRIQSALSAMGGKQRATEAEHQLILGIFQAAVKVQDRAKEDYLSFDYQIYSIASESPYNAAIVEVSHQGDMAEPLQVFLTIGLGMEARRVVRGVVENSTPVKATVICNTWDPYA